MIKPIHSSIYRCLNPLNLYINTETVSCGLSNLVSKNSYFYFLDRVVYPPCRKAINCGSHRADSLEEWLWLYPFSPFSAAFKGTSADMKILNTIIGDHHTIVDKNNNEQLGKLLTRFLPLYRRNRGCYPSCPT